MMQEIKNKDKEQDHFIQLVREKIEKHPVLVDDKCWIEIEQTLISNRRKVSLWVWISATVAASIALLLLIRTPFYEIPTKENTTTELSDDFKEENNQSKLEQTINSIVFSESKKTVSFVTKVKRILGNETNLIAEKAEEVEEIHIEEVIALKETESVQDKSIKKSFDKPIADWTESDNDWQKEPIKKKRNKWLLAASFGSGSRHSLGEDFVSGEQDYLNFNPQGGNKRLASSKKINDILYPEEFSDVTHYAPLSFGINIRKNINKHWAIESGLTYTYLLSKFRESESIHSEATLKMHYIGVPLNLVSYIMSNNSGWNLYVSAGGMIEKGLHLDFTHNSYFNGYSIEIKLKENIPDWQYSLNASLGADYKIYKDISVYIEPRITYYLNSNQPESIRTKNPFIVGFNTGLRLEF